MTSSVPLVLVLLALYSSPSSVNAAVTGTSEVDILDKGLIFCLRDEFTTQLATIIIEGETYYFNFEVSIPGEDTSSDLSVEDAPPSTAELLVCGEVEPTPAPVDPPTPSPVLTPEPTELSLNPTPEPTPEVTDAPLELTPAPSVQAVSQPVSVKTSEPSRPTTPAPTMTDTSNIVVEPTPTPITTPTAEPTAVATPKMTTRAPSVGSTVDSEAALNPTSAPTSASAGGGDAAPTLADFGEKKSRLRDSATPGVVGLRLLVGFTFFPIFK